MKIHWIVAITFISTIILTRTYHCMRRRELNKCPICGGFTSRYYQMIPFKDKSANTGLGHYFGNYYEPFIFSVCECKRVVLVKDYPKWFPSFEIWWRRLLDPKQFEIDASLFERAGLTGNSLPVYVRMLINRIRSQRHATVLQRMIGRSRGEHN